MNTSNKRTWYHGIIILINLNSFLFQPIEDDQDDSTFTAGLGASMPGLDDHDEADHVEDQDQDRFLPSEESRRGDESEESEDELLPAAAAGN